MPRQIEVDRIRGEYLEMPGLQLTPAQAQRLCGLDAVECQAILDTLVDANFLSMTPRGSYARATDGEFPRAKPAKAVINHSPSAKLAS